MRFAAFLLCLLLAPAVHARPRLRVMTWNIHYGAGPRAATHAPGVRYVDAIADALTGLAPDVVGLQEVCAGGAQSRFVNQRRRLAEKTGWRILYKEAQKRWGVSTGIAILTRHPVLEERLVEVQAAGTIPVPGRPGVTEHAERRLAQAARIHIPGWEPMWFVNTHFHSGQAANRISNFDNLQSKLVSQLAGPVVLLGDFNSRAHKPATGEGLDTAHGQAILRTAGGERFADALESVGKLDPRTFIATGAWIRLDWIYATTLSLAVESAFVTGYELSDHEAIVAVLRDPADMKTPAAAAQPVSLLGIGGL